MSTLIRQRCFLHTDRVAAARCPECGRDYCRECITEHEGRVMCASCLRATGDVQESVEKRRNWRWLWAWAPGAVNLVFLWFLFYLGGQVLLAIPEDFHEGTLWRTQFWGESEPDPNRGKGAGP